MKSHHNYGLKTVLEIDTNCKFDVQTLCIVRDNQAAVNRFKVKSHAKSRDLTASNDDKTII